MPSSHKINRRTVLETYLRSGRCTFLGLKIGFGFKPKQIGNQAIGEDAGFRNQLQGELQTRLSRYLVYPPLARARGWEGRGLLAFNIETDGQMENIRVAQSSGFAVLDDSALNSLYQVGRLAEAVAWLQGRPLTMQIPVIYQLRCFDGQACREDRVAVSGPENY